MAFSKLSAMRISYCYMIHLKVMTALLIGQPITNDVKGSRVTSDTSEIQFDNQTSDRGT